MLTYYTCTRNPIARAGVIRKLLAKGYRLSYNWTVSDYFTKWPASRWPLVVAQADGYINLLPVNISPDHTWIRFSPVTLKEVGRWSPSSLPSSTPVFPDASKYRLDYTKADGTVANYTISNPIEANQESITAYAFGRGVRTFKKAQVRSFSKIC